MKTKSSAHGFSLIELVVVIAIIGILATIGVPSYQGFMDKARYSKTKAEISAMVTYLTGIRVTEEKTLYELIVESTAPYNNKCIACSEGVVFGQDANNAHGLNQPDVLAAWNFLGFPQVPRDGWERPFFVDQNEHEWGPTDCRHDIIYSAGANHIVESDSAGDDINGDDIGYRVPFYDDTCNASSQYPAGFVGW